MPNEKPSAHKEKFTFLVSMAVYLLYPKGLSSP